VKETETSYDSEAVLDLLSKTGRVPEALARRLRPGLSGEGKRSG
jgi:hypothetical protein